MVLGKKGLQLEAWKFGVYLIIPIFASVMFNDPDVQKYWADYFQFMKYPANPNTNLKEEFEELRKKREKEKQQRKEYAEQMRRLQESAQKSREEAASIARAMDEEEERQRSRGGWLRWFGWRGGGNAGTETQ